MSNFKLLLGLAITLAIAVSAWSAAGDLITPRTAPMVLLSNGKVLIVGGLGSSQKGQFTNPLSSVELYDPATGSWRSTGSLNTPHGGEEFTSTLLKNGKVLVVGGSGPTGGFEPALKSAELYDPVTETWSKTANLITGRAYHTATLLENGKVLVVGGSNQGTLNSAEIYNPTTGTWSTTGNLITGRSYHTATRLLNGKVLVVGGQVGGQNTEYLTSAELYDPATGTWSPTGNLNVPYYWHTATLLPLLPNGKVLLVGSLYFETSRTIELYDPDTGTWTITGPINVGRLYHAAILLSKGKVLILGGCDHPSRTCTKTVELYNPNTGTWKFVANLKTLRSSAATMLQNGKVLLAGGWNESGLLSSAELYDAPIALPKITSASTSGKKLFVLGKNFEPGAVILLNGKEQKTRIDDQNPATTLIGTEAGKKIKPGHKLRVRNLNGTLSQEFTFPG